MKKNAAQTKTTLQKQGIFIISASAIVALFLIFYFAILPLIQNKKASIDYVYPGEYLDVSTLYMVEPLQRAHISKIEVKNENGIYVLNAKGSGSGKTFTLEGAEDVVLDEYSVSGVVVAAGQPITSPADSKNYRANEWATEADLAKYGLDAASDPKWFRVTRTDGTSYKIIFGDKLSAGSGCYAYVDDPSRMNVKTNEDGTTSEYYIVYVLDKTSYTALLYGKTALVNTIVGSSYMGNGVYYTKNFEIYRYEDGARKIKIDIESNEEMSISGATQYKLSYPGGYNVDNEVFTNTVLPTMVYFQATKVVGLGDEIYNAEMYEKYGLDLDRTRLENGTDKNAIKFTIDALNSESKDFTLTIYISAKQLLADGSACYYAYIPEQHEIVELSAETYEWLDWEFGKYVDLRMFFEYIGSLDYFSVLSADKSTDVRFTLTGNPYNHHVAVTDAAGNKVLVDAETGKEIVFDVEWEPGVVKPTFKGDFENFRALYYVLITRMLDGSEEPIKIDGNANPVLTVVAQSIQRDRNSQYYRYDANGDYQRDEKGNALTAIYEGGYVLVKNLQGYNKDGMKLTYNTAYYDEESGRYFVKAIDSADGNEKPRSFEYTEDGKLVPKYLSVTNTTAEYTLVTYEYKFYDLYNEAGKLNQTYMLVVPTTTTSVWRIEADGSRTLVSSETSENDNMASYIRRASVEKLVSDTGKALAGIEIDEWAVD